MKALVTGGAGFLGSHLVDALAAEGDEVIVLDNLRRGTLANLGRHRCSKDVRFVWGDIRDDRIIRELATCVEVVYHLAAQSNVIGAIQDTDYSFTANVLGTYNILKAAACAGVRRLVFASSREVYGEPESIPVPEGAPLKAKNIYGATKIAGEALCGVWHSMTGLECQVLRFANVYGPRDRDRVIPIWLERARRGEPLELYGGEQILDFVWVGTAVRALTAAAGCEPTGPINVGSGKAVTLPHLADLILEQTRSFSKLNILPARPVEVIRFVADVRQMQRVLDVVPEHEPLAHLSDCPPPNALAASRRTCYG
jgi:nucleoside-diphosphate-sugar epimerase